MLLSALDANNTSLGEKQTLLTPPECPFNSLLTVPVSMFHNLMLLSSLPDANNFPSGEIQTLLTFWVCPFNSFLTTSVYTFDIMLLPVPNANNFPLGEKQTLFVKSTKNMYLASPVSIF